MTTMRAVVINVPAGVGPDAWSDCFKLAATHSEGGVFGLNEAFTPAQGDLYERLADKLDLGRFGLAGPNPVFWDRDRLRRVRGTRRRLHGAARGVLARQWPGFNAGREATDVVLADWTTGEETAVICTHWAPQGPKVASRWRNRAHRVARRKVLKMIHRHLRAGRVVWLLGDFNVYAPVDLAAGIDPELGRFVWLTGHGVDKVGIALPRGHQLDDTSARTFKAPSDHKHGEKAKATWSSR
ncbi:hypothetical protein [Nocardioides campestrisoli]|uniref:hypothetical protein n=1 Tax=Nocardioides campestrisoli TaxID=2736757 RepID=UPI0015E76C1B|nr:hypothetical protein [Nocardioides campestrisoli]